jgi:hypothetical protein
MTSARNASVASADQCAARMQQNRLEVERICELAPEWLPQAGVELACDPTLSTGWLVALASRFWSKGTARRIALA